MFLMVFVIPTFQRNYKRERGGKYRGGARGGRYFSNIPTNPQFSGLASQSGQNSWKRKFARVAPPPPPLPGTPESPRNPSNNLLANDLHLPADRFYMYFYFFPQFYYSPVGVKRKDKSSLFVGS